MAAEKIGSIAWGHEPGVDEVADVTLESEAVKSSAGSALLAWNMMIGWPTFAPCR